MAKRRVKVMWDYGAFPLWVDTGMFGQASSGDLPVPEELKNRLQDWSDRMTTLMWGPEGPDAPGWEGPDGSELERLNAEGRQLALQVRASLDGSWKVSYLDEVEDEEVELG